MSYSGTDVFANKIVCGECGSQFGKKVWHSTDKYRCVIYRCNKKYSGKKLYKLIEENSTHAQNQDEYNKKYRDLADKSTKIQEKLDKITAILKDKGDRVKVLETYIIDLKASKNKLNDFDEGLFYALVDRVKVNKNDIKIIWKDGTESK